MSARNRTCSVALIVATTVLVILNGLIPSVAAPVTPKWAGGVLDVAPNGAKYWSPVGWPRYVVGPNPALTPGLIDAEVTQATIDTTMCRSGGYTSGKRTTRPTENVRDVATSTKRLVYAAYGITPDGTTNYGVDHLIPLTAGGANGPWTRGATTIDNQPARLLGETANLWPAPDRLTIEKQNDPGFGKPGDQFAAGKNSKTRLEVALNLAVCSHRLTLAEAEQAIATNWWRTYVEMCRTRQPGFGKCKINLIPEEAQNLTS
jgi:hypothetical protein